MSGDLLRKTRILNGLLQASAGRTLSLSAMSRVLGENVGCNTWILDEVGNILGYHWTGDCHCAGMEERVRKGAGFPTSYSDYLAGIGETRANLPQKGWTCVFDLFETCPSDDILITVVPVVGAGTRLGSLILAGSGRSFTAADLVLAEYGATMAGVEIIRRRTGSLKNAERRRVSVQAALDALSNAEIDAVRRILPVLLSGPGLLVTTRAARQMGCTRSVVVNALHKLKSAGVIESRSQGMKGTYVKVLNENLVEEIARTERRRRQVKGRADPLAGLGGPSRWGPVEALALD